MVFERRAGILFDETFRGRQPGIPSRQVYASYDERGVVYICWDVAQMPIYVGQTVRWPERRNEQMGKDWWSDIALIHVIPSPDRVQRLVAEHALIVTLEPRENIAGIPGAAGANASAMSQETWDLSWEDRRERRQVAAVASRVTRARNQVEARAGRGPAEVGSPLSLIPPWKQDPGAWGYVPRQKGARRRASY